MIYWFRFPAWQGSKVPNWGTKTNLQSHDFWGTIRWLIQALSRNLFYALISVSVAFHLFLGRGLWARWAGWPNGWCQWAGMVWSWLQQMQNLKTVYVCIFLLGKAAGHRWFTLEPNLNIWNPSSSHKAPSICSSCLKHVHMAHAAAAQTMPRANPTASVPAPKSGFTQASFVHVALLGLLPNVWNSSAEPLLQGQKLHGLHGTGCQNT